jgi:hypothetical protein
MCGHDAFVARMIVKNAGTGPIKRHADGRAAYPSKMAAPSLLHDENPLALSRAGNSILRDQAPVPTATVTRMQRSNAENASASFVPCL